MVRGGIEFFFFVGGEGGGRGKGIDEPAPRVVTAVLPKLDCMLLTELYSKSSEPAANAVNTMAAALAI
jgi:hypothetical protein